VYSDFFQCPVHFNQPVSRLTLNLSVLAEKIPTADPLSLEFYDAQCARLSADIDQPFRYVALVRDKLSHLSPIPSLEQLATILDIEPRTLQRRLKKENNTFGNLLQETRFMRAREKLSGTNAGIEQLAQELGFSDAVAFSHAFKLWTGMAPRQWREANRG
jgi:AraC-like DNA-binding protein